MTARVSRRTLMRQAAIAGAGGYLWTAGDALRAYSSSNDKLNLAIVGCGGRGWDNLSGVHRENIVALCDVDQRQAVRAFERYPDAHRFTDYRQMLDQGDCSIDAVVVSTPDHMHAPISLAAMECGKHVYCEKPLTWGIEEARLMAKTAREKNVATQMGTQGMAMHGARTGIEIIRSGVLGAVTELHVWTDRANNWWPQGVERPQGRPAVPPELDWDLWQGVAATRPYHSDYVPFKWRGRKDYGTGAVGDMGIHNAAMAFVGLQLGLPSSVEIVETSGLRHDTFPAWSKLQLRFPSTPNHGPITMYWYDGGHKPSAELIGGGEVAANGAIVVGEKAVLYSIEWTGSDWRLLPEADFRDYQPPAPSEPRAPDEDHYLEWIHACKGGPPAFCRFDGFAAQLTEVMLVANLALRTGTRIEWDGDSLEAAGCPEAQPFIKRDYRTGW